MLTRAMLTRLTMFVALSVLLGETPWLGSNEARADLPGRRSVRGDLFYNHYVYDHCSQQGVPAQLYLSPLPAPPLVGHTYYTYQPLLPHEYMYHHTRDYWSAWPGGSWSHTKVQYSSAPRWLPGAWLFNH